MTHEPRNALITGVGRRRGIGAAIALGLARDGWDLALSYWHPYDDRAALGRSADDLEGLTSEIGALGRKVALLPADLEQPEAAPTLLEAAADALGPITGLILSHCESVDSGFLDTTVESFDRHDAVNVPAAWQLIAQLASQLPPSGGRVVAVTSDHTVGNLPYGATKPGPVDTGWMDAGTRDAVLARQPTAIPTRVHGAPAGAGDTDTSPERRVNRSHHRGGQPCRSRSCCSRTAPPWTPSAPTRY